MAASIPVSVSQAAANALAAWLTTSLDFSIVTYAFWPQAALKPPRVVSVTKNGRRRRLDVMNVNAEIARVAVDPTHAQITTAIGSFEVPLQLNVWAQTDPDREFIINSLDQVLNAGISQTLGIAGADVVRDGVLVPLLVSDAYVGNVDCWFDEPDYFDDTDAQQGLNMRATYSGEARGLFAVTQVVPLIHTGGTLLMTTPDGNVLQGSND
jgi:hypothetical protein